jgi:PAS domain S-box-containing protein
MPQDGSSARCPINILLVDDREEDLLALEATLEAPDVRLMKASSGPRALRSVLGEDFAVILLDVSMPGMDGLEVARLIKQRARNRHTPIIFLTAEGKDIESIYRGYEAGAVDYILKPLDGAVVRAKVDVFVELHRRGEEIRRQAELLQAAERARREAELDELRRATERRYRNLAEAVPQLVWTAQPDGEASYFNQRWVDHTGFLLAQSLGRGWQSVIHPNDVQSFVEQWGRAIAAGEPLRTECRLRSSEGSYRWHLCEVLPERDHDQRITGWLGTFTDVNEHKHLEEESARLLLREQIARAEAVSALGRLDFLAEASNLLSRSLDARGVLQGLAALCAPRLASWCVVDVLGEDGAVEQAAFAHEDAALAALGDELAARLQPGAARSGVAGVLASGQPEVSRVPCDALLLATALGVGRAELVERLGAVAYASVPLCVGGRVLGAMTLVSARRERVYDPVDVALALDLGQRAALAFDNARLYARAQQAVRIRDEFFSIASHELRTPLSALELQAQSIRMQLGRPSVDLARVRAKIEVAERQLGRLSRLITEMLDVSRIEAGRLELDREAVELGELIHEVAARLGENAERAHCEVELRVPEPVIGSWDRSRLDQVVTNLLHNAIKYGEGKPVRVSLEADGEVATLTVEDHGIGIPAADQRRIFERFERAVSSRHYGGMGVGLFIVDQILKAHDGRIEVESEPGRGATFVVRLPRAAGPSAEGPPAPSAGST